MCVCGSAWSYDIIIIGMDLESDGDADKLTEAAIMLMKRNLPTYICNSFVAAGFDTLSVIAEMDVSDSPGNSLQVPRTLCLLFVGIWERNREQSTVRPLNGQKTNCFQNLLLWVEMWFLSHTLLATGTQRIRSCDMFDIACL